MYKTYFVSSDEELKEVAKFLKDVLKKGTIACFIGDLGAGKTHLIREILSLFGFYDVSSPTFSILNEYKTNEATFIHCDFYRIEKEDDLSNIISYIEENKDNVITLIEWPKFISCDLKVYINFVDEDKRYIKICFKDD